MGIAEFRVDTASLVDCDSRSRMSETLTPTDLEEWLSRPTPGVLKTLRRVEGDVLVLGAGGKMGPSLARMARRTLDEIGANARRVMAGARGARRRSHRV
jgi:hypothetical protein